MPRARPNRRARLLPSLVVVGAVDVDELLDERRVLGRIAAPCSTLVACHPDWPLERGDVAPKYVPYCVKRRSIVEVRAQGGAGAPSFRERPGRPQARAPSGEAPPCWQRGATPRALAGRRAIASRRRIVRHCSQSLVVIHDMKGLNPVLEHFVSKARHDGRTDSGSFSSRSDPSP